MTTPNRPHACPHCQCRHDTDDLHHMTIVNKAAPFYPLVELCDQANNQ